jgi:hypothetical protein
MTNNWPDAEAKGAQTVGTNQARFTDQLCVADPTGAYSLSPDPLPYNFGTTQVYRRQQTWFSGSSTSGQGKQVQGNNMQLYKDHGEHTGIF